MEKKLKVGRLNSKGPFGSKVLEGKGGEGRRDF